MMHTLEINSRGLWDVPPKLYVAARCTCNAWNLALSVEDLHAGALGSLPLEEDGWPHVQDAISQRHAEHADAAIWREAERVAARPDVDFY